MPLDTAFVEQGISLGSNSVAALKLPRVLMAWDVPTQGLSAGWARFVLERRFGQPVTAVRMNSRISAPERESRFPVGSSAKMISGLLASALATATR